MNEAVSLRVAREEDADAIRALTRAAYAKWDTNKLFVQNIRLYEALGYRVEREEELNGGVAVHMMKPHARD
jgi:predicted N-acetyltransferase YhbS